MTTTTLELTEGESIILAVRELLNTIPPDDPLADWGGCLIGVVDLVRFPVRERVCEFCGKPAAYLASYKTIPVPVPSSRYVCKGHRNEVGNCDVLLGLAS